MVCIHSIKRFCQLKPKYLCQCIYKIPMQSTLYTAENIYHSVLNNWSVNLKMEKYRIYTASLITNTGMVHMYYNYVYMYIVPISHIYWQWPNMWARFWWWWISRCWSSLWWSLWTGVKHYKVSKYNAPHVLGFVS